MKHLFIFLLLNLPIFSLDIEKPSVYKKQDVTGWIMSEKLDGIRAVWNGKQLVSKNGNIIHAPKDFIKNFPSFYLDGELWTKRDDFENIQNIVLDKTPSTKWKEITYNIFEVPYTKGNFNQRLKKAREWFDINKNKKVKFIEQIPCQSEKELNHFLENIVLKKGEGVIIKNPHLPYIDKRSKNSLKVKKFYDMEGEVTGINYDVKKRMKSLIIQLSNGVTFNLGNGFTNERRVNHPKVGDIITFKYYSFTKNKKPKFASFLRIRKKE